MDNKSFVSNKEYVLSLVEILNEKLQRVYQGGGSKAINKIYQKGKLTARERISYLLDDDKSSIEIGALVADDMYKEVGGCPSAGVVVKIGKIQGKMCVVVANDPTVKAGAWFPMTAKKNIRAQEIAMENYLPIIYLVDSAGIFLPFQDEVFPDKEHFGRIFRNNAVMSSMGIPQIAAIMGSCVAGGAYLPIMCDESIIVERTANVFLAGSYLVKAAIGEIVDNETLGGADTHCDISGTTDYKAKDDKDALDKIKNILDKLGSYPKNGFNRKKVNIREKDFSKIGEILPQSRSEAYDMKSIINNLVDDSFEEYKKTYGKTLITAYARIDGWAVGIVANQRTIEKNSQGEIQFGGVIYNEAAIKATRFIANCNQKNIPLVFIQDVTGFMVGKKSEHSGIIKDGAKMVNAVSNSVVPKFTIIIGNSYGAGYYAMCGKAYDPRLIIAWPSAEIAVMGGQQASNVILQMERAKLIKHNKKLSDTEERELLEKIQKDYKSQSNPYYAASRLWIDAVISPKDTRKWISMGIDMANHNFKRERFNMGVIQV